MTDLGSFLSRLGCLVKPCSESESDRFFQQWLFASFLATARIVMLCHEALLPLASQYDSRAN